MLPLLGAAIAGGVSLLGASNANKARRREAEKDRQFQSGQAGRQMAFQERMSGSEWQRGKADMIAAGINPALAYSQGGASAPMGASGSGSRADQQDIVSGAVSSAMQYKRLSEEIANMKAVRRKTEAETLRIKSGPGVVGAPAVEAATEAVQRLFEPRTMDILRYELGSSARSIKDALTKVIGRINRSVMRFPGSDSNLEVIPPRRR